MIPYVAIFAVTVMTCSAVTSNSNGAAARHLQLPVQAVLAALIFTLSLFAGLRSQTSDRDYVTYLDWFDSISPVESWADLPSKDPLFLIVGIALRSADGGLALFMFAVSLVALAMKLRVLSAPDYRNFVGIALIFLVSRFFLPHEFTQVRAALGIAFVSLSIVLAREGRTAAAFGLLAMAATTHVATIALVPIAIYAHPARAWKKLVTGIGVGAFVLALAPRALEYVDVVSRLLPYLDGSYDVAENSVLSFYFLAKLFTVIVLGIQWAQLNRGMRVAVVACAYGMVLTVLFLSNDVFSLRLAEMTAVFDCICFAYLFKCGLPGPSVVRLAAATALAAVFFASTLEIVNEYALL